MNYKKARGYLSEKEREYLFDIAKESRAIINVGVQYGASVHCFKEGNPNATIIAIDLDGNKDFEGNLDYVLIENDPITNATINEFENYVIFVKGNSNTIEIDVTADVIFIDGCHWGECLQNDIEKYSALATKYILFHDYSDAPPHKGVKQELDNWQSKDFVKIDQIDTIAVYKRTNQ